MKIGIIHLAGFLGLLLALPNEVGAQGTAFTYQGRLQDSGALVTGPHDFEFRLFNAAVSGAQQGLTVTLSDLGVTNGLFTAALDFGASTLDGSARWLEIAVRPGASNGGYSTLSPRQQLTATPYATRAANVSGTVAASQITGTLPLAQLPAAVLTNNGSGVTLSGTFSGDAGALTNLSLDALGVPGTFGEVRTISLGQEVLQATAGPGPNSVATGDVNADGKLDLAVTHNGNATVTILTNSGAGFTLAWTVTVHANPSKVQLVDINRDGHLDILCANGDHSVAVSRGIGNGLFASPTFHSAGPTLTGFAAGDLNSDGWPELALGTRIPNAVHLFVNDGFGGFAAGPSSALAAPFQVSAVELAEVTGDANLDLIAAYGSGGGTETNVQVFPGNGAGGLGAAITLVSGTGLKFLAVTDINRDGANEIVVGCGQQGARLDVFTNNGAGAFALRQSLPTTYVSDLATGDFNGDGWPDVAVKDGGFFGYTGMRLMVSDGRGNLSQAIHQTGVSFLNVSAGDLDGDGRSELIAPLGNDPGQLAIRSFDVQQPPGVTLYGTGIFKAPVSVEHTAYFSTNVGMDGTLSFGNRTRQMINLWNTNYALGVQPGTLFFRTGPETGNRFAWYQGGGFVDAGLNAGGGKRLMSLDNSALTIGPDMDHGGSIELGNSSAANTAPFIDFHFGTGSAQDFNVRLINDADGQLTLLGRQRITGSIDFGSQTRQMLDLWGGGQYGIGVQSSSLYFRCNTGGANEGFIWYKGGVHNDAYANGGGGAEMMHLVEGGLYVNGTFVSSSDRNSKENFARVEPREVLDKVAALPLSQWNYKADRATRHIGPMAQDFHAAFGVGPDDKHIATVDADGVALAAIQGLNEKVEQLGGELKHRDAENAELKARLSALEKIVADIRSKGN